MNNLSKSKLLAYRQCPKRLWLEIHRRDLMDLAASSQSAMLQGHEVGSIARKIYDPEGRGHFLDLEKLGFRELFKQSEALVEEADTPLFEAGFSANGALVRIPTKLDSDSTGSWTRIPEQAGQSARSDAGLLGFYTGDVLGVKLRGIGIELSTAGRQAALPL